MRRKYLAFTLAEVLITLGIIGIIAQMTIPTLMQSTEKQVEVTQLKKFYDVFGQGMKTYMVNQGCNDLQCTGIFQGSRSDGTWDANMVAAMKTVFNVTKSCESYTSGCGETTRYLDKTPYINGTFDLFYYGATFQSADGFIFMVYDTDATNCGFTTTSSSKYNGGCGQVYVDINGFKKPGIWGRDLFMFYIGRDGSIFPNGGSETAKLQSEPYESSSTYWKNYPAGCGSPGSSVISAGNTGTQCTARIMDNGWSMDY